MGSDKLSIEQNMEIKSLVVKYRGFIGVKQVEKRDMGHGLDRILRIEHRWRQASAKIQNILQASMGANYDPCPELGTAKNSERQQELDLKNFRSQLLRQDRLMRLVLGAYGRDLSAMQSAQARAFFNRQDLTQIAEQLAHMDRKAAALKDSVVGVLAANTELELQLKQARTQLTRLNQARRAALGWSDTLRAELDRKSEALRQVSDELASYRADGPPTSARP